MLVVTGILALGTTYLVANPIQLSLFRTIDRHRRDIIAKPSTRDLHPTITYFRELDRQLDPHARIFFSGVVGPNNRLFPFYFARTYLFPREVEISLDHRADFQIEGYMGVDCSSPEQLRTNGYDVMLKVEKDRHISALPLTGKGALKQ